MKLAITRAGALTFVAILLQACLGDGGSSNGGPKPPDPRFSVSTTDIVIAAEPGEVAPTATVELTVTDPPAAGVHVEAEHSSSGIDSIDYPAAFTTRGTLQVLFRLPALATNDTYEDTVDLRVCTDDSCAEELDGSPVTVRVSYTVSGGITGTLPSNLVEATSDQMPTTLPVEVVRLDLDKPTGSPLYASVVNSSNGLSFIDTSNDSSDHLDIELHFRSGPALELGTYSDNVTVTVCYEPTCVRQIIGSPFRFSTRLTVNAAHEAGLESLKLRSCPALRYYVSDAEYSKALDAIIMIGSSIENAIYVYYPETCTELLQFLDYSPTSLSVAPDGLTAAVGHSGFVSIVDLTQVGQFPEPVPVTLNVSTDVADVALTGNGKVHATSQGQRRGDAPAIHSVDIATNTEQLSSGQSVAPYVRMKVHPSGDFLYSNRGGSADNLVKWDISSGTASWLRNSPYADGEFGFAYYLWINEPGDMIFTASGNAFHASTDAAQDLVFAGSLQLPPPGTSEWVVRSLSQSEAIKEIALVESERISCQFIPGSAPCFTHLALYDSDTLNRRAVYSIPPATADDGIAYAQYGFFVMHNAAGTKKYLIGAIQRASNWDAEFIVSEVQ